MSELDKKAILIKIVIHRPKLTKKDKNVGREVAITYESDENMGRYTKHLIAKDSFKDVDKTLNKITPYLYSRTTPYLDGGWRLLPTSLYSEVETNLRAMISDSNEKIDNFVNNWEVYCKESCIKLGKLYCQADYPLQPELRSRFGVEVHFAPIPNVNDLRIQIDEDKIEEIKERVRQSKDLAFQKSMDDLFNRIVGVLERLRDRMKAESYVGKEGKEEKPRLFNSIISSIQDLIQVLPDLNITDDPTIERIRQKMELEFMNLDIKELKEDEALRTETAEKADAILENLKGMI
jgi:hypothetical protein